jgi:DNA-directed RNA polymerase subunit RPC12/RpoP
MSANKNQQLKALLYVAAFVAVVVIGGALLLGTRSVVGLAAWVILVIGGLLLLVGWHARAFAYQCRNCGHEFAISLWMDLISPQWPGKEGGWKYLRCPQCGRRSWAMVIPKEGGESL